MLQKTKLFGQLILFTFIFFSSFFLLAKTSFGEIPDPADLINELFGDYHSLRPDPGNPTEATSSAEICGGSIIFNDTAEGIYSPSSSDCQKTSDGNYVCKFSQNKVVGISIDLSQAKLPIMGNTEDVVNSTNNKNLTNEINDAEKTNEYVSWYLNGVTGRAEYPFLDPENPTDQRKIIDFSGPLKKLLPWEGQLYPRIDVIERAQNGEIFNQVVGCLDVLGKPIPCYDKLLSSLRSRRLKTWYLTIFEKFLISPGNTAGNLAIDSAQYILKNILGLDKDPLTWLQNLLFHWGERIPPLRENFDTFREYWANYKEWRGRGCIFGPFNSVICIDTPLRPNYWADLFPYVPFSSTEDKKGEIKYTFVKNQENNGTKITVQGFPVGTNSVVLSFPHMQETVETAKLLQETFTPSGIEVKEGSQMTDIQPVSVPSDCKILETRTSPGGDSLYPKENTITALLSYKAEFSCKFSADSVENTWDYPSCPKNFDIKVSTTTTTPLADQVWSQLVAGSNSIFRRIFPKTGIASFLGIIKDIPASSKVSYSIVDPLSTATIRQSPATLYFPHLGTVSEYFLKGIQTALRPKGYGDFSFPDIIGQPDDENLITNICSNECNSNPTQVNMDGVRERFPIVAGRWFPVGTPRIEKYDEVVNMALDYGLDPIFVLAVWIHESGASNYYGTCYQVGGLDPNAPACQRLQDFGINKTELETQYDSQGNILVDNFEAQLKGFMGLSSYYLDICSTENFQCPLEMWGSMYRVGDCKPTEQGNYDMASFLRRYKELAPTQEFPCYPSKLP